MSTTSVSDFPESRVTAQIENVPESRVTAHTAITPQIPPSAAPESQIQQSTGIVYDNPTSDEPAAQIQPTGIVTANPTNNELAAQIQQQIGISATTGTESTTEGEASSTSAIIGTTRNRAARISESNSETSSDYDGEFDERGEHSASTELARDESLQFTPSSQGSAANNSGDHVLDPEDL